MRVVHFCTSFIWALDLVRALTSNVQVADLLANVEGDELAAVSGDFTDAETLFAMRGLLHKLVTTVIRIFATLLLYYIQKLSDYRRPTGGRE